MISPLRLLSFMALMLAAPFVHANCDVIDVIGMYEDNELSKKEIRKECGRSIDDAPNCSVYKIIRLYDDGYDEDEIVSQCSSSRSSNDNLNPPSQTGQFSDVCQTPSMWCRIGSSVPVGTVCWCASAYGTQNGSIVPR
jgi:hypothetical protein